MRRLRRNMLHYIALSEYVSFWHWTACLHRTNWRICLLRFVYYMTGLSFLQRAAMLALQALYWL